MPIFEAMRTAGLLATAATTIASAQSGSIVNPLLPSGPDPWVTYRDGFYYYMHTTGRMLAIRKMASVADLPTAPESVVWTPPKDSPYSRDIWAPELHYLSGAWYIYFAADAGTNQTHRMWVLENKNPDPLSPHWTMKGKVADPADKWAIDATVFENAGKLYMVWSGWPDDHNGVQNLYIAEMENPWTIKGSRVLLSTPEYAWERVGDRKIERMAEDNPADLREPAHIDVNEGPAFLRHGNRVFLTYSAGACWTDFYSLGLLTASANSNLLDPKSWTKSPKPVFWASPQSGAYGTGHNSFFQSPDGKQDWILYHANSRANQGCGVTRSPRAQQIQWRPDGTPDFGRPVPVGTPIPGPAK